MEDSKIIEDLLKRIEILENKPSISLPFTPEEAAKELAKSDARIRLHPDCPKMDGYYTKNKDK